ncbi:uncharacterized protein SAPINGB_P000526 [Magnusiomyces paraingens]|uniref:Reverse transcriptase Ty1/copia-type domain-containing protein n=1 Tax=Magnusiomyces paraingens TaxID=2606893 RepID=A0A5E8B0P0_9ASCO|nr:uncharacterized protein SAPINGB_P000526 [Saprochaete ingens]VVT44768.1 unnamed protein product [Saprochaete ingens]
MIYIPTNFGWTYVGSEGRSHRSSRLEDQDSTSTPPTPITENSFQPLEDDDVELVADESISVGDDKDTLQSEDHILLEDSAVDDADLRSVNSNVAGRPGSEDTNEDFSHENSFSEHMVKLQKAFAPGTQSPSVVAHQTSPVTLPKQLHILDEDDSVDLALSGTAELTREASAVETASQSGDDNQDAVDSETNDEDMDGSVEHILGFDELEDSSDSEFSSSDVVMDSSTKLEEAPARDVGVPQGLGDTQGTATSTNNPASNQLVLAAAELVRATTELVETTTSANRSARMAEAGGSRKRHLNLARLKSALERAGQPENRRLHAGRRSQVAGSSGIRQELPELPPAPSSERLLLGAGGSDTVTTAASGSGSELRDTAEIDRPRLPPAPSTQRLLLEYGRAGDATSFGDNTSDVRHSSVQQNRHMPLPAPPSRRLLLAAPPPSSSEHDSQTAGQVVVRQTSQHSAPAEAQQPLANTGRITRSAAGTAGAAGAAGAARVPAPSSRHRHREASRDTVVVNKRLADLIEQNGYYVPNSALQRLARKENSSLILNRTNLITRPTDNLPLKVVSENSTSNSSPRLENEASNGSPTTPSTSASLSSESSAHSEPVVTSPTSSAVTSPTLESSSSRRDHQTTPPSSSNRMLSFEKSAKRNRSTSPTTTASGLLWGSRSSDRHSDKLKLSNSESALDSESRSLLHGLPAREGSTLRAPHGHLQGTPNLRFNPTPDAVPFLSHTHSATHNVPATSASVDEDSVVSTDSQSHSPASTTEADVEATSDEISIAAPYNSDSQGSSEHLADGIDFLHETFVSSPADDEIIFVDESASPSGDPSAGAVDDVIGIGCIYSNSEEPTVKARMASGRLDTLSAINIKLPILRNDIKVLESSKPGLCFTAPDVENVRALISDRDWADLKDRPAFIRFPNVGVALLDPGKKLKRDPRSLAEANNREDKRFWFDAAYSEFAAIDGNHVYQVVPLPAGRKALGTKWVLKKKLNTDGSIDKYKARLVVQGGLYVDDILTASNVPGEFERFFRNLSGYFAIKDEGGVNKFLGIRVQDSDRTISLDLEHYIADMIEVFKLGDQTAKSIPLPKKHGLDFPQGLDARPANQSLYRSILGKLQFAAQTARPDIAYATGKLAQYASDPRAIHMDRAYHVLSYLKGTKDLAIVYHKNVPGASPRLLRGWSDADWANDPDRKSISGFAFSHGPSTFSWKSAKQKLTATSTTEAELIAAFSATCEAVYFRDLLEELGESQPTTVIMEDNKGVLDLMKDSKHHERTKHIDTKYMRTRDHVKAGDTRLEAVASADNVADIFTKALAKPQFLYLRNLLGMSTRPQVEGGNGLDAVLVSSNNTSIVTPQSFSKTRRRKDQEIES